MLESNNVNSVTNRNNLFFDNIFCLPWDECIGLSDPTLRLTGSVGVCFQSVGPLPYAYSLYKIPPLNFGVGGPYKFPKFNSIQFIRNLEHFNIFRWKKNKAMVPNVKCGYQLVCDILFKLCAIKLNNIFSLIS